MEKEEIKEEKKGIFSKIWNATKRLFYLALICYGVCLLYGWAEDQCWFGLGDSTDCYSYQTYGKYTYYSVWSEESADYVQDEVTGQKVLEGLDWMRGGNGNEDSIAVYAQKGRRGYFNTNTGKSILLPKKIHNAWIFSEGLSLAKSYDSVFIYDTNGCEIKAFPLMDDYCPGDNTYSNGHLAMMDENGKYGLIDREGNWTIEPLYDELKLELRTYWVLKTEKVIPHAAYPQGISPHVSVLNDSLQTIMEGDWCNIDFADDYVLVQSADHSESRYGLDGKLQDAFVYNSIENMSYSTNNLEWVTNYDGDKEQEPERAIATLLKYMTYRDWEGLITADGHVVTPPLYYTIEAVSKGLYLCKYPSGIGVLINDKGQIVSDE